MKVLLLILAGLLASVLWLSRENLNLSRSFEKVNQVDGEQKNIIANLKNQLSVSLRVARDNENAQVRLRDELSMLSEQRAKREETITRLMNENETLRRWYRDRLPDVVRRLHTRTGCASAARCLQHLPESELMPNARQRTDD
jgi:LysB family phage lysis regulatory protein